VFLQAKHDNTVDAANAQQLPHCPWFCTLGFHALFSSNQLNDAGVDLTFLY